MALGMGGENVLTGRDREMKRYQLTSLQIRDMVSYVHHSLWVIVDHEQERLVFLVDYGPPNRKWSKSFEVWQRFVSQSRRSPFVNHQELRKVRRRRSFSDVSGGPKRQGSSPLVNQSKRFLKPLLTATSGLFPPIKRGPFYWLGGVVPAVRERWQVHGLYGCLAFEVGLADVVGINYLNQLQSDGSMALEVSKIQKREFGDFQEAIAWYDRGAEDESDGNGSSPPHKVLALEERAPSRLLYQSRGSLRRRQGQKGRQKGAMSEEDVTATGDYKVARPLSTELGRDSLLSRSDFPQSEAPRKTSPIAIPSRVQVEDTVLSPGFYSAQASPEPFSDTTAPVSDGNRSWLADSLGDSCAPVKEQPFGSPVSGKIKVSNSLAKGAPPAEAGHTEKGYGQRTCETDRCIPASNQVVEQDLGTAKFPSSSKAHGALIGTTRSSPCVAMQWGERDRCRQLGAFTGTASDRFEGKRPFRRQRSRSLDDPELRAVFDQVAERTAQIASHRINHPESRDPQRSKKRSRKESELTLPGGDECLVNLPRLRQTSLPTPSEPKSPIKASVPVTEVYTDRLVMFRSRDPLLPDPLREAICTDQRLLKMLESGLPTWAIFVQSYPALCHVYHPWMRRISGYLYFLISAVTVLIGFYDLYKNLPFVQELLHRLFGPLYDWVEQWQMGARLGYLGTMLFLQNFQKAWRAAQSLFRSLQYLGSVAFQPVAVPLMMAAEFLQPLWQGVGGLAWEMQGLGTGVLRGVWYGAVYVVSPVVAWAQAVSSAGLQLLYPLWTAFCSALLLPSALLSSLFSELAPFFLAGSKMLRTSYGSIAGTAQIVTRVPARQAVSAAKAASSEGLFRELWLTVYAVWIDLLWKVFGAVRRIVFGFLAFIFEINKHRLSTYNYIIGCLLALECATWQRITDAQEIMQRLSAHLKGAFAFSLPNYKANKSSPGFVDARDYFDDIIN